MSTLTTKLLRYGRRSRWLAPVQYTHHRFSTDVDKNTTTTTNPLMTQEERRKHYLADTQTLANFLDIGVVKRKGRVHVNSAGEIAADLSLVPFEEALTFPQLDCTNLLGEEVVLPGQGGGIKLFCFAFKAYGTTLTKTWVEPFLSKMQTSLKGAECVEISFIEYSWMSFAKGLWLSNLRSSSHSSRHAHSLVHFGPVDGFAADLLLPNKYTGYAYLVDEAGRVRWRASGHATQEEVDNMVTCARQLLNGG